MDLHTVRTWIIRLIIYTILSAVGFLILFPFTYMMFTSLKQSGDVFHYPPRLLPYSAETIEYNGEQRSVFEFEINGETRQLVLTDDKIQYGYFTTEDKINITTPADSQMVIDMPVAEAEETGESITLTDAVTGQSRDFDIYNVPVNGETQRLLLAHKPRLNIFVDPNDPDITAYGSEREATAVENLDFQTENYNLILGRASEATGNVRVRLDRALVNTALVTFGVTFGQLITSIFGGYAFARVPFPGRDTLFMLYLGSIMIPFVVLIIPMYRLMVELGWNNKIVALIVPWVFTAYGTFLMRQFFLSIPKEIEEAALLDGCSRFRILWTIFVPLSMPAIATQTIFTFLYAWNSFLWPFIIISRDNKQSQVLTLSLIELRNIAAENPNLIMTGAAVAILPPVMVFILAQRYFIESVSSSAVKG